MSTKVEVDREEVARGIVHKYMFGNAAVGLIPIPIVDLVAFTGVQLKMVQALTELYETEFKKDVVKGILISFVGSLGSLTVGAGLFLSALKIIPPASALVGMIALPLSSAAFTYAVGRAFIMHFEAGGNILNLDAKAMHKYFKEFYDEGMNIAKSKNDAKSKSEDKDKD